MNISDIDSFSAYADVIDKNVTTRPTTTPESILSLLSFESEEKYI